MRLVWPRSEVPSQYVFCHNVCKALFITPRQHYKSDLPRCFIKILAVGWGCILKLFYAIILVSLNFPYISLKICFCHSFSSKCMLELKFLIYHRAASLFSQASPVDLLNDPGICLNTKSKTVRLHE